LDFAKGFRKEEIVGRYLARLRQAMKERQADLIDPDKINFTYALEDVQGDFLSLTKSMLIEAQISGWLAPWFPELNGYADAVSSATPMGLVRRLAIERPILDRAYDFLSSQVANFPDTFMGVVERESMGSAAHGLEVTQKMMKRLNKELETSIKLGEGRLGWEARLSGVVDAIGAPVDTGANFAEVVARTAHHRAFQEGQSRVLDEPVIRDVFPYRKYLVTNDNRVRSHHRNMRNLVYHRDSELAEKATIFLGEHNCRCSQVPLTEADAVAEGIDPDGFPPDSPGVLSPASIRALDYAADEDARNSAQNFDKAQQVAANTDALRSRFKDLDPLGLNSEVEADVSNAYRVTSAERQEDGRWRVKVEGESRPIVVNDDSEIKPGQALNFKVAGSTEEEIVATKTVKKTVTVTVLAADRSGQYCALIQPSLNGLASTSVRPGGRSTIGGPSTLAILTRATLWRTCADGFPASAVPGTGRGGFVELLFLGSLQ
jgi:hypothetical protein